MNPTYATLQRNSFHRPPDWRWRRACWLVDQGWNFSRRRDDEQTGWAIRYLRTVARSPAGGPKRYPDIHAARQLHEAGGTTTLLVQARILARQTSAEISCRTGIHDQVIDTYEMLFFNCRDFLAATDWVAFHCIGRGISAQRSTPDPGVVLKTFAYFGGPLILK